MLRKLVEKVKEEFKEVYGIDVDIEIFCHEDTKNNIYDYKEMDKIVSDVARKLGGEKRVRVIGDEFWISTDRFDPDTVAGFCMFNNKHVATIPAKVMEEEGEEPF